MSGAVRRTYRVEGPPGCLCYDAAQRRSLVEHKYWTYIVASRTGTLYVGMTNDIVRRMWEHKSGEFEGFASQYHCDRLVYWESFDDVRQTIDREKQLKGWRRERKNELVRTLNPTFRDLMPSLSPP